MSLSFAVPPELADAYRFRAGQYLTLRTALDGAEVRRSYSICSGEDDGELRIAIKQVAGGSFSTWAQDALRPGTPLDVMTPTGRFGVSGSGGGRVHLGIAAGSGITPVLSLMKTVLSREPGSRFFLFYGSRATGEILFRTALEDLKDRYLGRVSVFHALSGEQNDVDVLHGRLDRAKLDAVLGRTLGGAGVDAAYLCGPEGLVADAQEALAALGVPPGHVHVERFTSAHDGRPRAPRPPPAPGAPPRAVATVVLDGVRRDVPVAENETVLDAAARAGLDLPFSCKGGMCSTCRAQVREGRVEMEVNYSLEPWELEAGYVLTCQARPTTDRLTVDFDRQ